VVSPGEVALDQGSTAADRMWRPTPKFKIEHIRNCICSSQSSKHASRHHSAARIPAMADGPKWRPSGLEHMTGRAK
jgi:hypothetical protein